MPGCQKNKLLALKSLSCFVCINLAGIRANVGIALLSTPVERFPVSACRLTSGNFSHAHDGYMGLSASPVWDPQVQAAVLASFFYGYAVGYFPAGFLVQRAGSKWTVGIATAGSGLFSLLTPTFERIGIEALLIVRILQGLLQCFAFIAIGVLTMKQLNTEYYRLEWLETVYSNLGIALWQLTSGLLAAYESNIGWHSAFYLHGAVTLASALMWMIFVVEEPGPPQPTVSSVSSHVKASSTIAVTQFFCAKGCRVPWLNMMSSRSVWAILIASLCDSWCFYTFLLCVPAFIRDTLTASKPLVVALAAMPFVAQLVFAQLSAQVVSAIQSRCTVKTVVLRKVVTSTGFLLAASCLVGLSLLNCSPIASVVLLILALGCSGLAVRGYRANLLDVAPRYASIIDLLLRTLTSLNAAAVPHVVMYAVDSDAKEVSSKWHIAFFISAGVYCLGSLLYTILAAGDVQPWAVEPTGLLQEAACLDTQAHNTMAENITDDTSTPLTIKPLLAESEAVA